MTSFLKLTDTNAIEPGELVRVNVAHIVSYLPTSTGGSEILLNHGSINRLFVLESVTLIDQMLSQVGLKTLDAGVSTTDKTNNPSVWENLAR